MAALPGRAVAALRRGARAILQAATLAAALTLPAPAATASPAPPLATDDTATLPSLAPGTPAGASTARVLRTAAFARMDSAEPPPAGVAWQPVALPHVWGAAEYRERGGWYRLVFRLDRVDPARPLAVYVPQAHVNAALRLNGVPVGSGGRMDDPMTYHWNHPFLFELPPALLRTGENELLLRLRAEGGFGLLSPVEVGDTEPLRLRHDRRRFWQAEIHGGLSLLLLSMAATAFAIVTWRREDTQYLWLGVSCLAWSVFSMFLYGRQFVVPPLVMQWLAQCGTVWWVTGLAHYVHRHTGGPRPRLEAALIVLTVIFNGLSLLLPPLQRVHVFSAGHLFAIATLAILIPHAVRHWRRERQPASLGLAIACAVVLAGGLHDVVITMPVQWSSMELVRELSEHRFYLTPYGAPIASMLLGLMLARRFVTTRHALERLNGDLERRVEASRQALARHFDERRQLERQQAATAERERIVREMHDGIGGQLMTALRGLERRAFSAERLADLLQESLDDLRLLIDSAATEHALMPALAAWRHRWDPRLEALGITMRWDVEDAVRELELPTEAVLQSMRILQEAVSNAIKHAQAGEVWIHARCHDGALQLAVQDDGVGLPPDLAAADGRHGLRSMRSRAEALGGRLLVARAEPRGTRVELLLPLAAA